MQTINEMFALHLWQSPHAATGRDDCHVVLCMTDIPVCPETDTWTAFVTGKNAYPTFFQRALVANCMTDIPVCPETDTWAAFGTGKNAYPTFFQRVLVDVCMTDIPVCPETDT